MGFGEVGDSCGRWRGQKRGGRRYVEVAKPRNLVTNHPTRKRPAIHFLISIPQPPLIYTFILITIDSSPTISPLPLSYLHPIYIRVESEISRIIVFYRGPKASCFSSPALWGPTLKLRYHYWSAPTCFPDRPISNESSERFVLRSYDFGDGYTRVTAFAR